MRHYFTQIDLVNRWTWTLLFEFIKIQCRTGFIYGSIFGTKWTLFWCHPFLLTLIHSLVIDGLSKIHMAFVETRLVSFINIVDCLVVKNELWFCRICRECFLRAERSLGLRLLPKFFNEFKKFLTRLTIFWLEVLVVFKLLHLIKNKPVLCDFFLFKLKTAPEDISLLRLLARHRFYNMLLKKADKFGDQKIVFLFLLPNCKSTVDWHGDVIMIQDKNNFIRMIYVSGI